jgi:hypothetical protein
MTRALSLLACALVGLAVGYMAGYARGYWMALPSVAARVLSRGGEWIPPHVVARAWGPR